MIIVWLRNETYAKTDNIPLQLLHNAATFYYIKAKLQIQAQDTLRTTETAKRQFFYLFTCININLTRICFLPWGISLFLYSPWQSLLIYYAVSFEHGFYSDWQTKGYYFIRWWTISQIHLHAVIGKHQRKCNEDSALEIRQIPYGIISTIPAK